MVKYVHYVSAALSKKYRQVVTRMTVQTRPAAYDDSIRRRLRGLWKEMKNCRYLYLMLLIPMAQYFVFRYAPIAGIQIAFKDYNIFSGMAASKWVGFANFAEAFATPLFWKSLKNTVLLNLYDLIFGFPIPIILAIMLYEMRWLKLKKIYQTVLYLPHFLSWIIIGGILNRIFASQGMINGIITRLGGSPVDFLLNERNWTIVYVVSGIWQSSGWGTIIYLAAISGVNTELYEAAEVDGCGRIKRIIHITIPCIMPTIIIMLILRLGSMVGIGFERPYVMANKMVRDVAEVTSTYVYSAGIQNARFSYSATIDLFGSIINMLFLITSNSITKSMGEGGLW